MHEDLPFFPQKDKNIEMHADLPLKLLLQTEKNVNGECIAGELHLSCPSIHNPSLSRLIRSGGSQI